MLAAFWSVPFAFRLPYANNMGWEKLTEYGKNLFPQNIRWVCWLALAGAVLSVINRRRTGLFFLGMATLAGVLFIVAPQSRLWNARILPFWYLSLYLLMGVAVTELGPCHRALAGHRPGAAVAARAGSLTPVGAALLVWMIVGLPLGVLPGWLPKPATTDTSFIPSWAKWNYSGYERKAAYPEYKAIVDTMADVGRTNGCGRAHWEYESGLDRFGTPMALMLLPYWTDGCIGSMEGLYFESSATVPYHFMSAAELSKAPSNPMRDLPVRHHERGRRCPPPPASRRPLLHGLLAGGARPGQRQPRPDRRSPPPAGGRCSRSRGSELVSPLNFEPAVVTGPVKGEVPWLNMSVNWYTDFDAQDVFLAASGPEGVAAGQGPLRRLGREDGGLHASPSTSRSAARSSPPVVSNISSDDNDISFDVDQVGKPVLVKASYFPNWKASGAKGPYRVTPNLMVVIPTSTHVDAALRVHAGRGPRLPPDPRRHRPGRRLLPRWPRAVRRPPPRHRARRVPRGRLALRRPRRHRPRPQVTVPDRGS